jgi:uncharacterized membrane protein YciS (DUF1049 family)
MNYLALVFTVIILVFTIVFVIGLLLNAADYLKQIDTRLKNRYVTKHIKKYRRKLFYGK